MSDTFIRIMLSSGHVEEGILENWGEVDEVDGSLWVVISIKGNSQKKLRINKKYIAAHQIEEVVNKKSIQVDEFVEKGIVKTKMPFNTNLIIKSKAVAERRMEEEQNRKREVSKEYSDAVYSNSAAIFKK